MRPTVRAWLGAATVAAIVLGLDQLSKSVVEQNIGFGETVDVVGPLQLTHVGNTGVAFGLAEGGGGLIIGATLIALALIILVFARDPVRPGVWPAIGLLLGGALGNLLDRIYRDAVTDFVKLPAWPSFNVADVAITCGVLLLAWVYMRAGPTNRSTDAEKVRHGDASNARPGDG